MSDIKSQKLSRRVLLQGILLSGAVRHLPDISKISADAALENTVPIVDTPLRNTITFDELKRHLVKPMMEGLLKNKKEMLYEYPPRIHSLDTDPAGPFFGGAQEVYRVEYPFSFIDYRRGLRSLFSSAVHFTSFAPGENMILIDSRATHGDMRLVHQWERNAKIIARKLARNDPSLPWLGAPVNYSLPLEQVMDEMIRVLAGEPGDVRPDFRV